jgi:hypothetical protein
MGRAGARLLSANWKQFDFLLPQPVSLRGQLLDLLFQSSDPICKRHTDRTRRRW